ncbi:MAG: TonB-dependent receptor [Bacteroidales bacterium]|jgi:outer membrane receptor for ferrienterochelin and colicin
METKKIIIILILLISTTSIIAQNLSGFIYTISETKAKEPVAGAIVYWCETQIATTSDINGKFEISENNIKDFRLIIKMLGFKIDTIQINKTEKEISHELIADSKQLKGVEISERNESFISKIDPRNVQIVNTGELYKAACCNLSESFETNASVDVNYSDAITGAKQIQLLGLSGIYSQIQTENIPSVRGMASAFGLNYIPGSWMQSIQISKGASSVINGFESITGQINVEYKKPSNSENLFVNLYTNNNLRNEININKVFGINDKLKTLFMISASDFSQKIDKNALINPITREKLKGDNFMDIPKTRTINLMNRWDYLVKEKFTSRFGIKFLDENRNGGTIDFNKKIFVKDTSAINKGTLPYGFELDTRRYEAFWKNGILFKNQPYKSVALILSTTNHEQKGFFGINNYFGEERTYYANFLYQSIIGNTDHKFTTGFSYIYDKFYEKYNQTLFVYNYQVTGDMSSNSFYTINHENLTNFLWKRTESVPGAFFEYTYNNLEKLIIIAGLRVDYHNIYGLFYTPRFNLRYHLDSTTTIRASAGLGYRTANAISENLSILSSQRQIVIDNDLNQEKALNMGINFTKEFKLFKRKAEFNLDLYRTMFMRQVIVDMDSTPTTVFVYNLNGKSYANSYQAQISLEPLKNLSLLLAYRINDVKTTISEKLTEKPFTPKYKGLVTLSYLTKGKKWQFDYTTQFNGSSRLPEQSMMPENLRRPARAPEYILMNVQITRKFKKVDIYIGSENLTDFKQSDPITEFFRPYHTYFDTAMNWGPIIGRIVYLGLRYTLK